MPRAPNENAETAKQMYLEGQKMVDIAAALDIPEGTIRSWKNRYKWNATLQKDNRNVAKKCGAPVGNKNAVGGPPGNKKAEKFGFFSKYLPPETKEIFDAVQDADPIDLLWHQIQIQYAAIVRAQRIMYVEDQEGSTKVTSMESAGSKAYMVQMAWDKQASFLQAQSRAMKTLQGLFKQYDELLKSDLATEEQKARIDRLRAEIAKVEAENKERAGGEQPGDDGFLEALNGSAAKDWADED